MKKLLISSAFLVFGVFLSPHLPCSGVNVSDSEITAAEVYSTGIDEAFSDELGSASEPESLHVAGLEKLTKMADEYEEEYTDEESDDEWQYSDDEEVDSEEDAGEAEEGESGDDLEEDEPEEAPSDEEDEGEFEGGTAEEDVEVEDSAVILF